MPAVHSLLLLADGLRRLQHVVERCRIPTEFHHNTVPGWLVIAVRSPGLFACREVCEVGVDVSMLRPLLLDPAMLTLGKPTGPMLLPCSRRGGVDRNPAIPLLACGGRLHCMLSCKHACTCC